MGGRATNRMAPPRYATSERETPRGAASLWRSLRFAFVPEGGSGTAPGSAREIVRATPVNANYLQRVSEPNGPAINSAPGNGFEIVSPATYIPQNGALSVVAFLVRRDSSTSIQSIAGTGAAGLNGWSFQLNYGAGQIGLTRWGIADNPSTTLGAVPNDGRTASVVALAYDGSNARFMLNGRFQTIASGGITSNSQTRFQVARNLSGLASLLDTSLHVVYVWARTLSDGELLLLNRDPWAPLRPNVRRSYAAVAAAPNTARVFVPAFIG